MGTKLMRPSMWMLTFIHKRLNTDCMMIMTMVRCYLFLITISEQCYKVSAKLMYLPQSICVICKKPCTISTLHDFAFYLKSMKSMFHVKFTLHIWVEKYLFMKLQSSKKCKKTRTPVLEVNIMPDKWLIQLHDVTFINCNKTFREDWVNIQHWRNYPFSSWS
jgi:hypothetical protein